MLRLWPDALDCGTMALGMTLLGLVGLLLGAVALVVALAGSSSAAGKLVGAAAVVVGVLTIGLGPVGRMLARAKVEAAVSGPSVPAAVRDRILEEGYLESNGCLTVGLEMGGGPLLFGAVALAIAMGRGRPRSDGG